MSFINVFAQQGQLSEDQLKIICEAAEKGDAFAQYKLGRHYYFKAQDTNNVTYIKDSSGQFKPFSNESYYKESAKWIKLSAQQGAEYGLLWLGILYDNGQGVPKNKIEACAYYNLAGMTIAQAREMNQISTQKMSSQQIEKIEQRALEINKEIEDKKSINK